MARILTEESSLTRRRRRLAAESSALARIWRWELVGAAALAAGGLALWLLRGQPGLLVLAAVLAAFGYGHRLKVGQNRQEQDSLEAGAQGEASTARRLNDLLDNTHYLFNDIVLRHGWRTAQIDHLVVCPRGVFVIETKNWRGAISGQGDDPFWQQVKRPGEPPIRLKSPALQVRRQAAVAAQLLRSAGLDWPDVVPVVAFASAKTSLQVDSAEVPVVHLDALADAMRRRGSARTYSEAEVDKVVALIMRRIGAA